MSLLFPDTHWYPLPLSRRTFLTRVSPLVPRASHASYISVKRTHPSETLKAPCPFSPCTPMHVQPVDIACFPRSRGFRLGTIHATTCSSNDCAAPAPDAPHNPAPARVLVSIRSLTPTPDVDSFPRARTTGRRGQISHCAQEQSTLEHLLSTHSRHSGSRASHRWRLKQSTVTGMLMRLRVRRRSVADSIRGS